MSGLRLTAEALSKCIKQNYFTFGANDVVTIDFSNPNIPFNIAKTEPIKKIEKGIVALYFPLI
jgi:hypothetical protein